MPQAPDAPFIIAAAQAAPVFLDRNATIDKACALIAEAGKAGARRIVFPEAFVPGYPDWVWLIPPGKKKLLDPLYAELVANSLTVPGDATAQLCRAARAAHMVVVIGISERNTDGSNASLYNTLLYIGQDGTLLGKHRKLVPTGGERLVWAQGDGSTLEAFDTPLGKIGGLICWENYMPLARYAMYSMGTQIYVAATWDFGEIWLSTLRHIAKEGRAFVIGCGMALRKDAIPDRWEFKQLYDPAKEWINPGGSAIVGPDGNFLAGPLMKKEELLLATIDPRQRIGASWILDVAGHYARPDVFRLTVNREPRPLIVTAEGPAPDTAPGETLFAHRTA